MTQTSSTNERQIRNAQRRAKKDVEIEKTVISTLMRTVDGRRWLYNQLAFAQVFAGTEALGHAEMAFEKGRRNTGLKLLDSILRHAPTEFTRMLEESSGKSLTPEEESDETEQD